jgi:hypothetical protein
MEHNKPRLPGWVMVLVVLLVLGFCACGGLFGFGLLGFWSYRSVEVAPQPTIQESGPVETGIELPVQPEPAPSELPTDATAPTEPAPGASAAPAEPAAGTTPSDAPSP